MSCENVSNDTSTWLLIVVDCYGVPIFKVQLNFCGRKPGEIAECSADISLAKRELGWSPQYDLRQMCEYWV